MLIQYNSPGDVHSLSSGYVKIALNNGLLTVDLPIQNGDIFPYSYV